MSRSVNRVMTRFARKSSTRGPRREQREGMTRDAQMLAARTDTGNA